MVGLAVHALDDAVAASTHAVKRAAWRRAARERVDLVANSKELVADGQSLAVSDNTEVDRVTAFLRDVYLSPARATAHAQSCHRKHRNGRSFHGFPSAG